MEPYINHFQYIVQYYNPNTWISEAGEREPLCHDLFRIRRYPDNGEIIDVIFDKLISGLSFELCRNVLETYYLSPYQLDNDEIIIQIDNGVDINHHIANIHNIYRGEFLLLFINFPARVLTFPLSLIHI